MVEERGPGEGMADLFGLDGGAAVLIKFVEQPPDEVFVGDVQRLAGLRGRMEGRKYVQDSPNGLMDGIGRDGCMR